MITLLTHRLGNQKILEGWETLNEVLKTKTKKRGSAHHDDCRCK